VGNSSYIQCGKLLWGTCGQSLVKFCPDVRRDPHHTTLTRQLQLLIRWSKFNHSKLVSSHIRSYSFHTVALDTFSSAYRCSRASVIISVFLSAAYHTKTATCIISCVDNGLVQWREIVHLSLGNYKQSWRQRTITDLCAVWTVNMVFEWLPCLKLMSV